MHDKMAIITINLKSAPPTPAGPTRFFSRLIYISINQRPSSSNKYTSLLQIRQVDLIPNPPPLSDVA
jgi:hypothetical protein